MTSETNAFGLGLETTVNRLANYNPLWPKAFSEEAERIKIANATIIVQIEHYGSTAVPGLKAKPIIDLLIGVKDIDQGLLMIKPMSKLGYDYAGDQGIPDHHIFGRGKARTHLAHVVVHNGDQWERSLRFRDRLRADASLRTEYERLKTSLAANTKSRADYTAGTSAFVIANSNICEA